MWGWGYFTSFPYNILHFEAAFLRLVCLANVPISVYCAKSQENNCHTIPMTGIFGKTPILGYTCHMFTSSLWLCSHDLYTWSLSALSVPNDIDCPHSSQSLLANCESWEYNTSQLDKWTNTDDFFDLHHVYQQSVGNRQVTNICTSSPFPWRRKFPQVTNVCQLYHLWECGLRNRCWNMLTELTNQVSILYDMIWFWKLNFVSWIDIHVCQTMMETWELSTNIEGGFSHELSCQ
jgi:hypothetical protein